MALPEISEKTHIRMSMVTTIAVAISLVGGVNYVNHIEDRAHAALTVAEATSEEVEKLTLTVRISDVKRNLKDLQSELRSLKRAQADDPDSTLIRDQIAQVEDEIEQLASDLRCLRNSPEPERCDA